MFADDVYRLSEAQYYNRVLLIDTDRLNDMTNYCGIFAEKGFTVIWFSDDLTFRVNNDEFLHDDQLKLIIIAKANIYIPYDIRKMCHVVDVTLAALYPRLNSSVLREPTTDFDLLSQAYAGCYDQLTSPQQTASFMQNVVNGRDNVKHYIEVRMNVLKEAVCVARTYQDWFRISDMKAQIDVQATQYEIQVDTEFIDQAFENFILNSFGTLSSVLNADTPVLVSRAMEYMHEHSDRFVIIVMDGMSQFDWEIISESFVGMNYTKADMYAMIPTVTSVSRQCLLSNKYPLQLINPWSQSKEKQEFTECATDMGYLPTQMGYERGYDAAFAASVKCGAVIINDVDDMVHGQMQGRIGMLNDIGVLSNQKKLVELTKCLISQGFDVYITADHGNTPCVGMGKLMGTGVETETKSRRMLVLKDFADKQTIKEKYQLIEYPKYYLNKSYDYLICPAGKSFDAKNDEVMSHGGITLDEVIVPFIKIKAGDNNG